MGSQVGSSSVIFGIFLVSYFVTLWTFVVVYFWVGPQAVQWLRDLRPALGLGASDWLIWVSVGAFTGLPPFILFYAKVALLSLVFSSGGYGMAILCLGLVLIGWGVYVGALRQLVGSG
jgi:NADH:ubiquinone oxidoreductase subunit 2 (subunit N)